MQDWGRCRAFFVKKLRSFWKHGLKPLSPCMEVCYTEADIRALLHQQAHSYKEGSP